MATPSGDDLAGMSRGFGVTGSALGMGLQSLLGQAQSVQNQSQLGSLWNASSSVATAWPMDTISPHLSLSTGQTAEVLVDDRRRLHSVDNRPAINYSGGRKVYYWHGVEVPAFVVLEPAKITVEMIEIASNAELRRVLIEKYGLSRFLIDSGAKIVSKDSVGELYEKLIKGEETIKMVKVLNSTLEPDGTRKPYFLRVPPRIKTAKEAIAWTFQVEAKDYQPAKET